MPKFVGTVDHLRSISDLMEDRPPHVELVKRIVRKLPLRYAEEFHHYRKCAGAKSMSGQSMFTTSLAVAGELSIYDLANVGADQIVVDDSEDESGPQVKASGKARGNVVAKKTVAMTLKEEHTREEPQKMQTGKC